MKEQLSETTMNSKQISVLVTSTVLIIGFALFDLGCKKDESPTNAVANNAPYGSGTITATSTAGPLSITGTGVWPLGTGPSVLAMYDTTIHAFIVYGYQQVSGPRYNVIALLVFMSEPQTGTYPHPGVLVAVAYNADSSMQGDTLAYGSESGSIVVSSVSGSNASGTYSVMARKGTGQPIQFTGTFNVTYVVGVMPEDSRRKIGRSFQLTGTFQPDERSRVGGSFRQ